MKPMLPAVVLTLGVIAGGVYLSLPGDTPSSDPIDWSAVEALREDQMRKLMFHPVPREVTDVAFLGEDGTEVTLAAFEGKHVVLNFWATWCAPCRKEMPSLNNLQEALGGEDFEVVTVASGRNPPAAIDRFFAEIGVESLPKYRDPEMAFSREMAVAGLPITVVLNPEGQEIARMQGDAYWDTDSAKAIVSALISEN